MPRLEEFGCLLNVAVEVPAATSAREAILGLLTEFWDMLQLYKISVNGSFRLDSAV